MADGILLLRVGVKVGIKVVGIDAEDGKAGAAVRTAEAQQRRPRHPRGGAHLIATAARPQAEAEEGGRSGRNV
jgi:predicted RNA-binding protein with RPS1 domain